MKLIKLTDMNLIGPDKIVFNFQGIQSVAATMLL